MEPLEELVRGLQALKENDPAKYLEVLKTITAEVEEMKAILQ